jgi:hypothetical protein
MQWQHCRFGLVHEQLLENQGQHYLAFRKKAEKHEKGGQCLKHVSRQKISNGIPSDPIGLPPAATL